MKIFRLSHHHPCVTVSVYWKQKELCSMWSPEKWIWMETRMSRLEGRPRQGQWEAMEEGKVGGLDRWGTQGTSVNQPSPLLWFEYGLSPGGTLLLEGKCSFPLKQCFATWMKWAAGTLLFLSQVSLLPFPKAASPKPQSSSLPVSSYSSLAGAVNITLPENPVRQGMRGQPSRGEALALSWGREQCETPPQLCCHFVQRSLPCYILNQECTFSVQNLHVLDTPERTFPQTHGTILQSLFPEDSLANLLKQLWQV